MIHIGMSRDLITSAKEVMFSPGFVCEQDNSKSYGRILTKVLGYGVVIYPTAVYASCDIGLAYPTAVYTRFISSLAYPTAIYTRSVLVHPYFNHFFLKLTLLKCNNKLNKFNSESGPWPISDYSKKFLKN